MSDRDFNRGRRGWNRDEGRPYDSGERNSRERRPTLGSESHSMVERYKSNRQMTDWMIPGPYTGMGPKGYRRKDERILDEINERLTRHGQVDASDISVGVSEGMVILNGTVSSRREKHIAEYIAESVSGVQDVHNNLRVASGESQRREWKAPGEVFEQRFQDEHISSGWSGEEGQFSHPETLQKPRGGKRGQPEATQESRSSERKLADSSIPNTGTVSAGTLATGSADPEAGIASTPSKVSGGVTGATQRRGARSYGMVGSNVPSTGGQSLGGMPHGDTSPGGTPSQSGPTGGVLGEDMELEKPDLLHETGTEAAKSESEPPAALRGEGLTPMPGGEAELPTQQAPRFDGIRHEAPEMGGETETTQAHWAELEHGEPGPTHGPAAVASGPTDIAEGSSGSTLGDLEETHAEPIPQTGGAFKGGAFGEPIDTGVSEPDQPAITIPGQIDFATQLQPGMTVLGSDGEQVGTVKEVRDGDFLLDRPMARDIYVPFRACDSIDNTQLTLTVAADAITQQGWESPALF